MQIVRNRKKKKILATAKCLYKCCVRWCADESSVPIRWFVLQWKATCACNVYTWVKFLVYRESSVHTCVPARVCVSARARVCSPVSIHSCTQALLYCGIRESISSDSIELPPIRSNMFLWTFYLTDNVTLQIHILLPLYLIVINNTATRDEF